MLKVSEAAVQELSRLLAGQPEAVGVRVYIKGFGWGGPSVGLALAEPDVEDRQVEGARVWVQPGVDKWYPDAELDFEGGFYFRHPDYEECGA